MPITRVLDATGRVIHDCDELGCEVSWDGVPLKADPGAALAAPGADPSAAPVPADLAAAPPPTFELPAGYVQVDAATVQAEPPPTF